MFGSAAVVTFQNVFHFKTCKIFFYFLKIIFDITTLK